MRNDMIRTAGIVGAGLIGASWATLFLANGLRVVAVDPDPAAADKFAALSSRMLGDLKAAGLVNPAYEIDRSAITFETLINESITDVDFVQENVSENIDLKSSIIAALESRIRPDVVIASSTTALLVSDIQRDCRHPERIVAGHPINPPHLIPLVEVSGGAATGRDYLIQAFEFYASLGKHPVLLNREIEGHIAGRLSAALWREAVALVADGVASVEAIDEAVLHGPGLRWAALGPNATYHVGGGPGGLAHYISHLGGSQQRRWDSLGAPTLDDNTARLLIDGINAGVGTTPISDIEAMRDQRVVAILRARNGT